MASSAKPLLQFTDPVAIIVDVCLIGATVAAYLPQIRQLRKSTTGETPSIAGLSPLYIFSHGIFCNYQLSFALLTLWGSEMPTKLSTFDSNLCAAQLFAQWICAMSIVVIYMMGSSKQVGGKFIVPALVYMHAFFFVFFALKAINEPKGSGSYAESMVIQASIAYMAVLSMPLILLLQLCAQYWELRKMADYGALSPRSCCMQAAVMAVMALRLFIRTGPIFDDVSGGENLRLLLGTLNYVLETIPNVLAIYFICFLSLNFLLWVVGAAIVYIATRASKTCMVEKNVELGVVLH